MFREAVELRIATEREERLRTTRGKALPERPSGNSTHEDRDGLRAFILAVSAGHRSWLPSQVAAYCSCSAAHVIACQRRAGIYRAARWHASEHEWRMPDADEMKQATKQAQVNRSTETTP